MRVFVVLAFLVAVTTALPSWRATPSKSNGWRGDQQIENSSDDSDNSDSDERGFGAIIREFGDQIKEGLKGLRERFPSDRRPWNRRPKESSSSSSESDSNSSSSEEDPITAPPTQSPTQPPTEFTTTQSPTEFTTTQSPTEASTEFTTVEAQTTFPPEIVTFSQEDVTFAR